jgi:hypothetical protein
LLAKHTADKLGISLSDEQKIKATGVSGSTSIHVIHNQRLDLGQGIFLRLRNLAVADNREDGLLGATIFRKYVCLIDYDNQQLDLYESIDDLDITELKKFLLRSIIESPFHNWIWNLHFPMVKLFPNGFFTT